MKALKIVGIVVGVVALAATGVGLALGGVAATSAAGGATFLGMSGAAWMTVGAVAGLASAAIGMAASFMQTKPTFNNQGNPLDFQTNPQSGLPYCIGRTRMSGLKIDGRTAATVAGGKHDLLFLAALLSCHPSVGYPTFSYANSAINFDGAGQAMTTGYAGWLAHQFSRGEMPQSGALQVNLAGVSMPGWGASHKLSGMPHAQIAFKYDPEGEHFTAGFDDFSWIDNWSLCYDPRKDSTYPGGSGAHRVNDWTTWEASSCPGLNGLKWAMGHWANGKLVAGIGAPLANIRVSDFVETANICDANAWRVGGVEWTTDSKWDIFKRILQAGNAMPTKAAAMIGCRVRAPRISIGTVGSADFMDSLVYPATKSRRDRFSSVLPRYVSENHSWQVITGSAITVPAYVTADGGLRTKGIDYPLVQAEAGIAGFDGNRQVGQLAAYDIVDSREAGPIEFTTGPRWIGLHVGDCVTLNKPEDDIVAMKVVLTSVTIDPASGKIHFVAQTETDSKHAFALGASTTPPPAPSLSVPAGRPAVPGAGAWSIIAITLANGQPGLRIVGAIDDLIANRAIVDYRRHGAADWIGAPDIFGRGAKRLELGPLDAEVGWDVRIAYAAGAQKGDYREYSDILTGPTAQLTEGGIPMGVNAFANGFFRNGLSQWMVRFRGVGADATFDFDAVDGRAVIYNPAPGTGFDGFASISASDGSPTYFGTRLFRVFPGQRIALRLKGEVSRAAALFTGFFRFLPKTLGADLPGSNFGTAFDGFTTNLEDGATETACFIDVPADAYWLDVELFGFSVGVNSPVSARIEAVQLSYIDPAQTVPPLWGDGPMAYGEGKDGIVTETTGSRSYSVNCTGSGVPKSGALAGAAGTMQLRDAAKGQITSGVTDFILAASDNCGAVIDNVTGAYSFTGITSDNGKATFRCTYDGIWFYLTITLNKVRDGTSFNGESDSAPISDLSSTSYPSPDAEQVDIDIILPTGQTLSFLGRFDYSCAAVGSFTGKVKVTYQNISDGGAETDYDSAAGGGASRSFVFTDPFGGGYFVDSPNYAQVGGTIGNISGADKLYRLRLYVAKDSGTTSGAGSAGLSGSTI